jgi:hypothetical protein
MENRFILTPDTVSLDKDKLFHRLGVEAGTEDGDTLSGYLDECRDVARPKAYAAFAFVEGRDGDAVKIDGTAFSGRLVQEKLGAVDRVYPYVVTCGTEIEEWSLGIDDIVEKYWIDCIKEEYLRAAFAYLKDHLKTARAEKKLAHLSPGSLSAWPLPEQRKLFTLLGDVKAAVGVELTPSCLMLPAKSISGILFPTETNYENCMHCPRRNCPNRRAAFKGAVA